MEYSESLRRMNDECYSDLQFDQYRIAVQEASFSIKLDGHIVRCQRCQQRYQKILADAQRFDHDAPLWAAILRDAHTRPLVRETAPAPALIREGVGNKATTTYSSPLDATQPIQKRSVSTSRKMSYHAMIQPFAAAAALLLVSSSLWWIGESQHVDSLSENAKNTTPSTSESNLRLKGGLSLGFHVLREDTVFLATPEDRLLPNDHLRFFYSSVQAGYLAILSLDARGHQSVYFPDHAESAPVHAGVEQSLTSSVILDDTLGHERVYVSFCDKAHRIRDLWQEVLADPFAPQAAPGCKWLQMTLNKAVSLR